MFDVQDRIDRALRALGGYWPPLAGLARVLEELGEIASAAGSDDLDMLRSETADCTVAVLALANQYCVRLVPAGKVRHIPAVIPAGQLARQINRIEGIKPPKPAEPDMPPLETIIADLLVSLASQGEETLEALLSRAINTADANVLRDTCRFAPRIDPVTTSVRDAFWDITSLQDVPLSPSLGLWGLSEDAADRSALVARFQRLDAIHPMVGLLLAALPADLQNPRMVAATEAATLRSEGAGAGSVRAIMSLERRVTFVLLEGRRAMPQLRADLIANSVPISLMDQ